MEALFTSPPLSYLLAKLDIRTPQQQIEVWIKQKKIRELRVKLRIGKDHAEQLEKRNISFEKLKQWKAQAKDAEMFETILKLNEVRSKILIEKLKVFFK